MKDEGGNRRGAAIAVVVIVLLAIYALSSGPVVAFGFWLRD